MFIKTKTFSPKGTGAPVIINLAHVVSFEPEPLPDGTSGTCFKLATTEETEKYLFTHANFNAVWAACNAMEV